MNTPAKRTILIYGLSGMELIKMVRLCKEAGICCKAIASSKTNFTVSQLLSDEELPPAVHFALNGKFALLDGFAGHLEDATNIINQVSSGVIKAIHTPHNTNWRFSDLCFAIQQEQNAIENIKKDRK